MVVPCNATFNTAWELWLGADPGRLMPLLNALEIEHYPLLQVGGCGEGHNGGSVLGRALAAQDHLCVAGDAPHLDTHNP